MKYAIVGTVGVPGNYGGFETLAENLVRYGHHHYDTVNATVFCSSKAYTSRPIEFHGAKLEYIGLDANGIQSILYDVVSLVKAVRGKNDVILLLGVSGAIALPFVKLLSRSKIITNIDGIEWKRDKWKGVARTFLRWSESLAVRWSHAVVADNEAIAKHVRSTYNKTCTVIAYGGDHALNSTAVRSANIDLPDVYALALCRIEPENNISMILDAFSKISNESLVFVGNWSKSEYGRKLYDAYHDFPNLYLLDPIYEPTTLRWIRDNASVYVHGHSAGGTNPSLVEMMHFGIPVYAYDCEFNRFTTEDSAIFFGSSKELINSLQECTGVKFGALGENMRNIACRRYTWNSVGREYFELFEEVSKNKI